MTNETETRDDSQAIFTKTGNIEGVMQPQAVGGQAMSMFDLCAAVCSEYDYRHTVVDHPAPDTKAFAMGFNGEKHSYNCFLEAHDRHHQIIFYAMAPDSIPEDKRLQVMEFLTRANYGARIGNFEMDLNDGEIRYKSSITLEGAAASPTTIHCLMGITLSMMDRYYEGIMRIIYGDTSAKDAIKAIEQ